MNTNCQTIIFSDSAYNAIITETFKKDPLETGGILLGHILDNGIWIVLEVLPPGWRSVFQYAYFEYDQEFVNYVAENESKKYNQELQLLGLWHRHPGSMDTFSGTDDKTNEIFAGLNAKGAISGIVNIDPRFRLTMYHVSNPLTYQKIDIEIGNDLIPDEYFKLKYYNENKIQNPLPAEKKKESKNSGNQSDYTTKKISNNDESIVTQYDFLKNLNSKLVFLVLFFLTSFFSLFSYYSYSIFKSNNELTKLNCLFLNNRDCDMPNKIEESDNRKENKDSKKEEELKKDVPILDTFKKDSSEILINSNKLRIDSQKNSRSVNEAKLNKNTTVPGISRQSSTLSGISEAETSIVAFLIMSFVSAILSLILVFITKNNKQVQEWKIMGVACVTSMILAGNYFFSLAFIIKFIFLFVLLSLAAILISKLIKIYPRKTKPIVTPTEKGYWFQTNPELYIKEENDLKERFPNQEKTVENGIVSFLIADYKPDFQDSNTYMIQLVYAFDYSQRKEIKVYLIVPEIDELIGNKLESKAILIDRAGESYLNLSSLMPQNKVSGITIIEKLEEWLKQNIAKKEQS
jgi:hypothetical protein